MTAFLPVILYLASIFWRPLFHAAMAAQAAYILSRGISLGRLPLVGLHDTLTFLSLATAVFSLPFHFSLKGQGGFLKSAALLASAFAVFGALSSQVDTPLPPVLRTYWFELHVVLSFFSYGLFGIGAILGLLYLLSPDTETEALQYKAILIGYLLFSLSMVFGGIWAFLAWGTYWLWTPKEIWTTLLWLSYTLYLHLRFRPWWTGKRIVTTGIAGYFVVLFTYLGVGLLMKSSHSF
ncbi:MAG: cytochrome c biogenesis protein CcsA [Nitrospirae bacterium]|nr:cytochrome c biogenesis protein CcsA [Nitrospirota bacterium]